MRMLLACSLIVGMQYFSCAAETSGSPENSMLPFSFYRPADVRTEFFTDGVQLYMVFLPMSESQFFCPGIVLEERAGGAVSVRFVRQPITDPGVPGGVQAAEHVRVWKAENPDCMVLAGSVLKDSPAALMTVLPAGTAEIILGPERETIQTLFLPVRTPVPHSDSAVTLIVGSGPGRKIPVTDPNDLTFLRQLFGREHTAEYDDPACSFDYVRISFADVTGTLDFYPAADGCPFVRYGTAAGRTGRLFVLEPDEARELTRLWRQYASPGE